MFNNSKINQDLIHDFQACICFPDLGRSGYALGLLGLLALEGLKKLFFQTYLDENGKKSYFSSLVL